VFRGRFPHTKDFEVRISINKAGEKTKVTSSSDRFKLIAAGTLAVGLVAVTPTFSAAAEPAASDHRADSNRQAMGCGHTDAGPIIAALREIGYAGYLSAEVFPLPDSLSAARLSLESFRRWASPN